MDISIVIPTRNRAAKLCCTLEGLCSQSIPSTAFEVLIVDNGSSDGTRETALHYVERFANWQYLCEPKPGAAAARNAGIKASQGRIILFLDDDVIPDRELLKEHLARHREENIVVLGSVRFPWNGTESVFYYTLTRHPELLQSFRFPDPENVPFLHFYTCNLSVPRSFFEKHEALDDAFGGYGFEDIDLGYRITQAGLRIVFHPKASALHDFWLSFGEFAAKQRQAGHALQYLLNKHPELRPVFLPARTSWRRTLSALVGSAASVLAPFFDVPVRHLSFVLLPTLARFCWSNLQYQFWAGFRAAGEGSRA